MLGKVMRAFEDAMNAYQWEKSPTIAVALSGGQDSTALTLCAQVWCEKHNGKLVALHVDHGMRSVSSQEAQCVLDWCRSHNITGHILTCNKVASSQETARLKRYNLLGKWCEENKIYHLLVGHHAWDQAETVIMRQKRKSSGVGLMGMQPMRITEWGRILRPLLTLPPQGWDQCGYSVDDASNQNMQYERVQVRTQIIANASLREEALHLQKQSCQEQESQHAHLVEAIAKYVRLDANGVCVCAREVFDTNNPVHCALLKRIIMTVSGKVLPIRLKVWDMFCDRIPHWLCGQKVTLGGCVLLKRQSDVCIMREYKRIQKIIVKPGKQALFDGRFIIDNPTPYTREIDAWGNLCSQIKEQEMAFPAYRNKEGVCEVPRSHQSVGMRSVFMPMIPLMGYRFSCVMR